MRQGKTEGEPFGRRVYRARMRLGGTLERELTQAEVGEAIGVSGQAVSMWERGENEPKLSVILRLAEFLRVEPAWLAWGIPTVYGKPPETLPVAGEIVDEKPTPSPSASQRDDRAMYETLKDRTERRKKGRRKRA